MEHYLAQMHAYRSTLPEPDVTLEKLRQVLFAFFGVKEPSQADRDINHQVRQFGKSHHGEKSSLASGMRLTKEEADAWDAAGMPSPFDGWLKGYRDERR